MPSIEITFNLPTVLLLSLFLAGSAATSIAHHQVGKAAKWLFQHDNTSWIELGRPGTLWFKGSKENSLINRMSGWKNLRSEMGRNSSQLSASSNVELAKLILRFRQWRKRALISLLAFLIIVFMLALRS